jgi:hypothetical protein
VWQSSPEATIDSVLMRQNGGVEWNVSFACNFNDWELDIVAAFLDQLYSHVPASNDKDGLWWQLKKTGFLILVLSILLLEILLRQHGFSPYQSNVSFERFLKGWKVVIFFLGHGSFFVI